MNSELKKAFQNLMDFLEKHPEMADYQLQIDRRLEGIVDAGERLEALKLMILERNRALQIEVEKLKELQDEDRRK